LFFESINIFVYSRLSNGPIHHIYSIVLFTGIFLMTKCPHAPKAQALEPV
jgi:hypothetical protein